MDPHWHCCVSDDTDGHLGPVRHDESIPEGPPDWEPPPLLRGILDFLALCCEWLVRCLVLPVFAGVGIALPISILACCVFYDAEWPLHFLFGVLTVFAVVAVPVLIGTFVFIAGVVLAGAGRCVWGLVRLVIGSPARKPAPARRKGEAAVWDRWLDGV